MQVDPLGILFTLIRISAAILLIIFFMSLWSIFNTETKTNDLQKFNVELYENIATSELTFGKYVFDQEKLDQYYGQSSTGIITDLIRDCKYKYFVAVEDTKNIKKWFFGDVVSSAIGKISESQYGYEKNTREYYAGMVRKNSEKPAPFYEDADTVKITVTVYDTLTGRLSCAIEKAYKSKKAETLQIKKCIGAQDCLVFRRNDVLACFYSHATNSPDNYMDCKILPTAANGGADFVDIEESANSLKIRGIDVDKPLLLTAYPLKDGAPDKCDEIEKQYKNDIFSIIPKNDETVKDVKVCLTN